MPATDTVLCREILEADDPVLPAARALYESTLEEAERIPWEWLDRTPARRRDWKPGQRRSHLIVAMERDRTTEPIGFGYGAFLPGFGGYVCYMGVNPSVRGRGIGTQLFQFLFELIDEAAQLSKMALPLIVWESHRPDDDALWAARVRVFDRVGGLWAKGIELVTPNYMQPEQSPVRLQLFVRPTDESRERLDAGRLRDVIRGLYQQVYHIPPDDPLHRMTMAKSVNPRLVPAVEALEEA
jgi:GNAT superfamily N-acetyltransferase